MKPTKEPRKKTDRRLTCISDIHWIEEVLGYRYVMEISKFHQVEVDKRETEINHKDESPTFDEEREDREIRENEDNKYKFSSYFISTFSCVNLSWGVSLFSPCFIQQIGVSPLSFWKIFHFFKHKMRSSCYWQVYHSYKIWNAWKQPSL